MAPPARGRSSKSNKGSADGPAPPGRERDLPSPGQSPGSHKLRRKTSEKNGAETRKKSNEITQAGHERAEQALANDKPKPIRVLTERASAWGESWWKDHPAAFPFGETPFHQILASLEIQRDLDQDANPATRKEPTPSVFEWAKQKNLIDQNATSTSIPATTRFIVPKPEADNLVSMEKLRAHTLPYQSIIDPIVELHHMHEGREHPNKAPWEGGSTWKSSKTQADGRKSSGTQSAASPKKPANKHIIRVTATKDDPMSASEEEMVVVSTGSRGQYRSGPAVGAYISDGDKEDEDEDKDEYEEEEFDEDEVDIHPGDEKVGADHNDRRRPEIDGPQRFRREEPPIHYGDSDDDLDYDDLVDENYRVADAAAHIQGKKRKFQGVDEDDRDEDGDGDSDDDKGKYSAKPSPKKKVRILDILKKPAKKNLALKAARQILPHAEKTKKETKKAAAKKKSAAQKKPAAKRKETKKPAAEKPAEARMTRADTKREEAEKKEAAKKKPAPKKTADETREAAAAKKAEADKKKAAKKAEADAKKTAAALKKAERDAGKAAKKAEVDAKKAAKNAKADAKRKATKKPMTTAASLRSLREKRKSEDPKPEKPGRKRSRDEDDEVEVEEEQPAPKKSKKVPASERSKKEEN